MPTIIEITDILDRHIEPFRALNNKRGAQTVVDPDIFIAESPKVIKVAMEEGYRPDCLLCERRHIQGDASWIIEACPDLTVFTGEREVLAQLTGYTLTRGVLCAMKRKPLPQPADILHGAKRVAVIEAVCDTTNIGSIFRSAAALGIDAILLTPDSCDPLNRRSVRVSMGTVFKIPWTFADEPVTTLNDLGFTTIALALKPDSLPLDSPQFQNLERAAMVLGTEGEGLTDATIAKCRYTAIIPMARGVDSLNVGSAAAVAFWQLRQAADPK